MKIKTMCKSFFAFCMFAVILLSLSSCGSGSSSNVLTSNQSGTGSVAIMLTDYPIAGFSEIIVTITKIELLSDDDRVTIFSGSKTVNLLDLKNETMLFSVENNIPSGMYEKIRLTLSSVKLIDEKGKAVKKPVKLPGNGKVDLKPSMPFAVSTGAMLTVQLDLDAEKSLKLHENKNKYIFRPVIFVKVISDAKQEEPEKIMRVNGIVRAINTTDNTFTLCSDSGNRMSFSGPNNIADNDDDDYNNDGCVTVNVSDETSFFSSSAKGAEVPFDDLEVGDTDSVIGFFDTQYWKDDDKKCHIAINAAVVEIGEFIKLMGTIVSEFDSAAQQFDFQIDPGQPVESTEAITVQLQEGTKLYSTAGKELDKFALIMNTKVEIDGTLLLDPDPDELLATFISIDTDTIPSEKLSGEIQNVDEDAMTFDLITSDATVCVEASEDTQIFLITDGETLMSEMINFSDLADTMQADVYGIMSTDSACLAAETIIAFDSDEEVNIMLITDPEAWEAMVADLEVFETIAENIVFADEVATTPNLNEQLGSMLTFQAVNSGISADFAIEALETGAGFTFSDTESGVPLLGYEDALSVGDNGNFEDDDWRLSLLGGASMMAFGVEVRESTFVSDESIILYAGGESIGSIDLSTIPVSASNNYFIGIIVDVPFDAVGFDEDPDGDDIAIADFRFGSITP